MTDPRGRQPIGIAQPPGQGGINYPLSYPSADIKQLLADLFLCYAEIGTQYVLPFSIKWLYGFGADPAVGTPPATVYSHEIEIQDATGATVFSSLDADTEFTEEAWGTRLKVLTWRQPDSRQYLHVVYHTEWSPEDVTQTYPIYFEPESAQLDPRTIMRTPAAVSSVKIGLTTYQTPLVLTNGYNTTLIAEELPLTDGGRRKTRITFNATPGIGAGRFEADCGESAVGLRSINNVSPNEQGQFFLDTAGCYRIERPIIDELAAVPARAVQIRNHTLQLFNDCGPCCDCDDFIAVWEAIRRLRNRYATLVSEAQAARDLYHENRARFVAQQECRINDRLRLIIEPSCPDQVGVAVGYCNNSAECLEGVVIHVSFAYLDGSGCLDLDGNGTLMANTTATLSTVVCDSTFRGGFIDPSRRKNKKFVSNEFYTLGGSWPHFWVHFPLIDAGSLAYTTFRLQFYDTGNNNTVEAVADAFLVGARSSVVAGSPVPGYVLGSGCSTEACEAMRLVDCPVKEAAQLVPVCCEESVSVSL